MSGSITGYGLLQALSADSATVRGQLSVATQQAATGKVAEAYAGLGVAAKVSLDLRPQVAHQQAWSADVDSATARLGVDSLPMNNEMPISPSLPTTAISADAPSSMTYSNDTMADTGK